MKRIFFRISIVSFFLLFLFSHSFCLFFRFNTIIKEINDFKASIETSGGNNKHKIEESTKKSENFYKSEENISSNGLKLYKFFLNFFVSSDTSEVKPKTKSKIIVPKMTKKKEFSESFFEKVIITDLMFIYALAEIFISISLAFIVIPVIIITRNLLKSCKKNKIKEKFVNNEYDIKKIIKKNNITYEDVCSICLDEILKDNCYDHCEKTNTFGHLNCHHNFHSNCIKEWIKMDKNTCPFCRQQISTIMYLEM